MKYGPSAGLNYFQYLNKAGVQAEREVKFYVPFDDGYGLIPKYVVCQLDGGFTLIGGEESKRLLRYGHPRL